MDLVKAEPGGKGAPATITDETDPTTDLTAAAVEVIPPEIVAQSLGQYLRTWLARARSGDAGVLPVAIALVAVTLVFTIVSPNHVFLSAGNLVNLFDQSAVFIVLAMGEGFVLLLGEIDLSIGYVGAIGGIVAAANLVQPDPNWPWWAAIIAALLVCAAIGAIHGLIITRLGDAGLRRHAGRLPALVRGHDHHPRQRRRRRHHQHGAAQPAGPVRHRVRLHRAVGRLDRAAGDRRAARRDHVAARRRAAPQRPGRSARGPDGRQDRLRCRRRDRGRGHLQREPRQLPADRRRALGRAPRPRRAGGLDGAAGADQVRAPHVRGRRQCRGGPPGRHQRAPRAHAGVRPLLAHGGHRRHHLLLAAGRHDHQHQRRPARPVRRRRRGHRRHQPVRRPRPGHPRPPRRPGDRGHLQRPLPAGAPHPVAADRHRPRPPGRGERRFALPQGSRGGGPRPAAGGPPAPAPPPPPGGGGPHPPPPPPCPTPRAAGWRGGHTTPPAGWRAARNKQRPSIGVR